MIEERHIAEAKKWSWKALKDVLGIIVIGGGLVYVVAAPWAKGFIIESVAGTIGALEKKTDVYIRAQTIRTNEIKNKQSAILENQRIREISDREMRRNVNEILRLMRKNGSR